ncbi:MULTISPECIES: FecCD family ABC transporter permease [unclassified Rathayibacter]|uniref:FecCD family ABC transporter permease n=1 Tax=unclassified Rathayibacter TaxID=2609250 RepID=UPI00188D81FE|nr:MULTISPECIES: iron ABC transporter permease [unclassified Rathayibacter]MBF4462596.1 iron ABC transporter permease [Rathayibacter sp. VKM Ac-2879]MBF4503361.1 iron ABC transporter permease [Rathayibacter sp. VKM Ac-2878]
MLLVRAGGFSLRWRTRPMVVFAALVVLAVVLFGVSISVGSTWLSPIRVAEVLGGGGGQAVRYQVLALRLPRAVIGAGAGAALAISGALLQSAVRNPLASPDILGITSGASAGAASVYILGWRVFDAPLTISLPLAAVLGGSLAAALVFAISRGSTGGIRLILVGIGVNAALVGVLQGLLVFGGTYDVMQAQVWLTGDLSSHTDRLLPLLTALVLTALAAAAMSRSVRAMQLGEEVAHGIGVAVDRTFVALLVVSVVAASVAVSAAGPLGFVALASPQVARLLTRETGAPLGSSAACGAVLVLAADLAARTLFSSAVSVGLLTAMVGGPMLIVLMLRRVRSQV